MATTKWVPTLKLEVENVALWVVEFKTPAPKVVVPLLNVTVPLTVPPKAGVTVAVKTTALPCVAGFNELLTTIEVAALLTISVSDAEMLEL